MKEKVDRINAQGGEAEIKYYAPADETVVLLVKCPECKEYNNGVIATSGWCWWCGWNKDKIED